MTALSGRARRRVAGLVAAALALPGAAANAQGGSSPPGDGALCMAAIGVAEQGAHLPAKLLGAIALVESGRIDPATGRALPWPWTIDVAGTGHFYASKAEAIVAVQAAQAAGIRSIDVGCMQINLMHHPTAFASLDEAFDPAANTAYAALFLTRLFHQVGTWPSATASYHSSTPGIGDDYARRVAGLAPLSPGLLAMSVRGGLARPAPPSVDPLNVLTPEFRARLERDAADRAARMAGMRMPLDGGRRRAPASPLTRLAQAVAREGASHAGSAVW